MSPNTSPISDGCEQPDLLTRIKEMNERLRLRRLGRVLSGLGIAMMAVSAVLAITSIVYPHRWHLGTFVVPLRSFRGPIQICFIGFVAWYLTVEANSARYQFFRRQLLWLSDKFGIRELQFVAAWRVWNWRKRLFLAIAVSSVVAITLHDVRYPQYLDHAADYRARVLTQTEYQTSSGTIPSLEYFAREVIEQTPPDARILFVGRTSGIRLAFEIYPRKVFMLPKDYRQMAIGWHIQPWFLDVPEDIHQAYWHQFIPIDSVDEHDFIREHHITHIARFNELDRTACKLESIR
jgi:hypothetical protein